MVSDDVNRRPRSPSPVPSKLQTSPALSARDAAKRPPRKSGPAIFDMSCMAICVSA